MNGMFSKKIVVRVYGICIRKGMVLLSDERLKGFSFTKFPGGGLEFGEGTVDCLVREMKEESGLDFNVISHFYTTDFFQESAFHPGNQIISVYYLMDGTDLNSELVSESKFDFKKEGDEQKFRWISLEKITDDEVTFPIDKIVVNKILQEFS